MTSLCRHPAHRATDRRLRRREHRHAADRRSGVHGEPVASGSLAGQAHAGVLLVLSLLVLRYVGEARLSDPLKRFVRGAFPAAAILRPAAFFLSVLSPGATEPNSLIHLAYVGAVDLSAGSSYWTSAWSGNRAESRIEVPRSSERPPAAPRAPAGLGHMTRVDRPGWMYNGSESQESRSRLTPSTSTRSSA
jgi:hypothetical protein